MKSQILNIFIICIVCCRGNVLAHTEAEEDACVKALVEAYQCAPENSDVVNADADETLVEPWFPTIDSLFSCLLDADDVGEAWSPEERRVAFENYMSRLSISDRRQMTRTQQSTCLWAISICNAYGYTNCLQSAKDIVQAEYAPQKDIALKFLFRYAEPSLEMNDLTWFVVTNAVDYRAAQRNICFEKYLEKIAQLPMVSMVRTNMVERIDSGRNTHRFYRTLDTFLLATDSSYETSTNRYALAVEALQYANPTSRNAEFFRSITNRLGRTLAP